MSISYTRIACSRSTVAGVFVIDATDKDGEPY
jgi:hypothetical protein